MNTALQHQSLLKTSRSTDLLSPNRKIEHQHGRNIKPVLKWVGGKRQLLPALSACLPDSINRYYELFFGGGALFFHMGWKTSSSFLADVNPELVNLYRVIRKQPRRLIARLKDYRYEKDFFYKTRQLDPTGLDEVSRAARFLFLNKTCYNGLYRVNRSGQFNVPFGRYTNPQILDAANIMAAHSVLQKARLLNADFEEVTSTARRGDFVYFDPPYVPLNPTSNFTSYSKDGFNEADQARLAETFTRLARRGVNCMLSNSSAPLVKELYSEHTITELSALRNVNSRASSRGPVTELLVTSYSVSRV